MVHIGHGRLAPDRIKYFQTHGFHQQQQHQQLDLSQHRMTAAGVTSAFALCGLIAFICLFLSVNCNVHCHPENELMTCKVTNKLVLCQLNNGALIAH